MDAVTLASHRLPVSLLVASIVAGALVAACGGGGLERPRGSDRRDRSRRRHQRRLGGKPATPPTAQPVATEQASDEAPAEGTSTPEPAATDVRAPTETPTPRASDGSTAPAEGRWIEVDVTNYVVRLMDGATVMQEIAPVAVGVADRHRRLRVDTDGALLRVQQDRSRWRTTRRTTRTSATGSASTRRRPTASTRS